MIDPLITHALSHLWCAPNQDLQITLGLHKITQFNGERQSIYHMHERIFLPDTTHYYHVYVIGQNYPGRFNFPFKQGQWTNLAEWATTNRMIPELYTADGKQYPRGTAYIARLENRNIILAVRHWKTKIASLNEQRLYLRVYTNAFYKSDRAEDLSQYPITIAGGEMLTTDAIVALQQQVRLLRQQGGAARIYHNGLAVDTIDPITMPPGDIVEFIHDFTYHDVVDYPLADLVSFESSIDSARKYLIHPAKDDYEGAVYQDDVDFEIMRRDSDGYNRGVYLHRNDTDTIRMVTHRDYSVRVAWINNFIIDNDFWDDTQGIFIRVYRRLETGWERPLGYGKPKVNELYRLDDDDIIRAMVGSESTIEEWQVANLEASSWSLLQGSAYSDITLDMVVDAYGYDAMAHAMAGEYFTVDTLSNPNAVLLTDWVAAGCTVFEYDADGLLLEWHEHSGSLVYQPHNESTVTVDLKLGTPQQAQDAIFGNDPVTLRANSGYALFITTVTNGVPDEQWVEIADDDTDHVTLTDGVVTWTHLDRDYLGAVFFDTRVACYDYVMNEVDGFYRFHIVNITGQDTAFRLVPKTVELWMNGRYLIPGLDYVIQFPEVIVCNKKHLVSGDQHFTICCSGISHTGEIDTPAEKGFTQFGKLSYDTTYNIRDGLPIHHSVNGRLLSVGQLPFKEDPDREGTLTLVDGLPYTAVNLPVPIRNITPYRTDINYTEAMALRQRISNYLTSKIPAEDEGPFVGVEEWYLLYSPMLEKLYSDIRDGYLTIPEAPFSDQEIKTLTEPYRYILAFDPCCQPDMDWRFIRVDPFTTNEVRATTVDAYFFLQRVVEIYLNYKVDLNSWLTI